MRFLPLEQEQVLRWAGLLNALMEQKKSANFPSHKNPDGKTRETFCRYRTDRRTDRQVQVACVISQVALFDTASYVVLTIFWFETVCSASSSKPCGCVCTRSSLHGSHFVRGNRCRTAASFPSFTSCCVFTEMLICC